MALNIIHAAFQPRFIDCSRIVFAEFHSLTSDTSHRRSFTQESQTIRDKYNQIELNWNRANKIHSLTRSFGNYS